MRFILLFGYLIGRNMKKLFTTIILLLGGWTFLQAQGIEFSFSNPQVVADPGGTNFSLMY